MSWLSDLFSHGGAKLLFFVVIILFQLVKVASKKKTPTPAAPNRESNGLKNAMRDSPVSSESALSQTTNLNRSSRDASPWASNQNPFDSSTQKKL